MGIVLNSTTFTSRAIIIEHGKPRVKDRLVVFWFLGLFWNKFLVEGRQIVEAIFSKLIQALIQNKRVIIRDQWHPNPKLLITLQDWHFMAMLKEKVIEIKHTVAILDCLRPGYRSDR
jgi:hypothetical protein